MYPYSNPQQQHPQRKHQQLLQTVQHCEATCEQMITMLLNYEDVQGRKQQIQHLRDCADTCALMTKFLARKSSIAKALAQFCSYVCEVCGRTCAQFSDAKSQDCARTCLNCAQDCKTFAG